MQNLSTTQKLVILVIAWMVLGGGVGGGPVPFPSDDKAAVIVLHDSTKVGSVPVWVNGADPSALRGFVESQGGEFRLLDPDKAAGDVNLSDKWQKALTVPHASLPWVAGANKRKGISEPLPSTREESIKRITPVVGGK